MKRFRDRKHASGLLADRVFEIMTKDKSSKDLEKAVVLGLPRGGLPLADAIARKLKCDFDIIVPRKIGVPGHEEYACGAITPTGYRVLDMETVRHMRISDEYLQQKSLQEQQTAIKREAMLRGNRQAIPCAGKIVFLVDDGIATGMTVRAAIGEVLSFNPQQVVVATPVIAHDTLELLKSMKGVDKVIALLDPRDFRAVGLWYDRFDQMEDEEAKSILHSYWCEFATLERKDAKDAKEEKEKEKPKDIDSQLSLKSSQ